MHDVEPIGEVKPDGQDVQLVLPVMDVKVFAGQAVGDVAPAMPTKDPAGAGVQKPAPVGL